MLTNSSNRRHQAPQRGPRRPRRKGGNETPSMCRADAVFTYATSTTPFRRLHRNQCRASECKKRWSGQHVPPQSWTIAVDTASASKEHVWRRTTSDDRAVDLVDSTTCDRERTEPERSSQDAPWLFGRQPSGSFQVAERRCGAEGSQCKSVLALPPPVAAQPTGHKGRLQRHRTIAGVKPDRGIQFRHGFDIVLPIRGPFYRFCVTGS